MKNRNTIIYILFAVAILVFFYFFNKSNSDTPAIDWKESYAYESREPYGTKIVYTLLQNYFLEEYMETLTDSLPRYWDPKGNYIFIGEASDLDSLELTRVKTFIREGGKAFFSSKTIPAELLNDLFFFNCEETAWRDYASYEKDSVALNFLHPDLEAPRDFIYKKIVRQKTSRYYPWQEISLAYFCDEIDGFVSLGSTDTISVHFAKIPYGKGQLLLHSIPLTFTNIQVLDSAGIAYVEKVFSHLQEGPIYWDAMSQISEQEGRNSDKQQASPGPLTYILKQPALAWAWYLLLVSAILYIIFRAKRKQRIIPVLAPNRNTSLEFIGTMGHLYFMQNDHRKLCLEMIKQWQFHIRERYHIATKQMDDNFIKKVANKAEINEAILSKLVKYATNIQTSSFVSETTLGEFYQLLARFYKKSK